VSQKNRLPGPQQRPALTRAKAGDGVIEARDPAGAEWGVDGLRKAVGAGAQQAADGIVRAIFTALDEFSQGCQGDDTTVVVLRVG